VAQIATLWHSRPRLWAFAFRLARSQGPKSLRRTDRFLGFKRYYLGQDSPITAITRDVGDYPIFDVSTQSVTLTVGRLWSRGCWPFWVSRLHLGDSLVANRLCSCCRLRTVRRCRSRREPTAHI